MLMLLWFTWSTRWLKILTLSISSSWRIESNLGKLAVPENAGYCVHMTYYQVHKYKSLCTYYCVYVYNHWLSSTHLQVTVYKFIGYCALFLFCGDVKQIYLLSVPKFTANLYCICWSITQIYTSADAVQICGNFWDTQYIKILLFTTC